MFLFEIPSVKKEINGEETEENFILSKRISYSLKSYKNKPSSLIQLLKVLLDKKESEIEPQDFNEKILIGKTCNLLISSDDEESFNYIRDILKSKDKITMQKEPIYYYLHRHKKELEQGIFDKMHKVFTTQLTDYQRNLIMNGEYASISDDNFKRRKDCDWEKLGMDNLIINAPN